MSKDKRFVKLIIVVSVLIPIVVSGLMLMPKGEGSNDYSFLPLFHAGLNGMTAIALFLGFYFVKQKELAIHKACMIAAFFFFFFFLVSYVFYHFNTGHVVYGGEGMIRYVYFFILITHILLATAIVPMALLSIYRGLSNQIDEHKQIAKWTLPIWIYVAITGVLVYLFMSSYYG